MKIELETTNPLAIAIELVNKFKPFVYPFIGSSMLTNTEDESVIMSNAKLCANISIDEKIETCNKFYEKLSFPAEVKSDMGYISFKKELDFLQQVKKEISNL
jgi:hypothetical protein